MELMNAEPGGWSEVKQRRLQEHLVGRWAQDTWDVVGLSSLSQGRKQYLHFSLTSTALKTELQYAVWSKFDSGEWRLGSDQRGLCSEFTVVSPPCERVSQVQSGRTQRRGLWLEAGGHAGLLSLSHARCT